MQYIYTKENQLKYIERYAYTKVYKKNFLDIFNKSRLSYLENISINNRKIFSKRQLLVIKKSLDLNSKNKIFFKQYYQDIFKYYPKKKLRDNLNQLKLKSNKINDYTVNNFEILIAQLINEKSISFELIDFYISRYENTKRIFSKYLNLEKKGTGSSNNINLYINFSIILSLSYLKSKNLKILNTFLKINDLILSVDNVIPNSVQLNSIIYLILIEKNILLNLKFINEK
jgi:hypothetical protein